MTTLNTNHLTMMVSIIDLGCEKGIFKGPDLKPVGELREVIVEFIKHVESLKESTNELSQPTE